MKFLIKLIPILLVTANYRYTHCEIVFRQVVEEYDVSSIYTAGNMSRFTFMSKVTTAWQSLIGMATSLS